MTAVGNKKRDAREEGDSGRREGDSWEVLAAAAVEAVLLPWGAKTFLPMSQRARCDPERTNYPSLTRPLTRRYCEYDAR